MVNNLKQKPARAKPQIKIKNKMAPVFSNKDKTMGV